MTQDEKLAAVVSNAAQDIGSFIRTQREAAQVSVRQLAEKAGVSNPYLSQIERGLRKPSADVLSQIAKALRVSAEVLYIRAGMLEPSEDNEVRDVIITDTAKEKPMEGKVIAVGAGAVNKEGKRTPLEVKAGDRVLFGKYAGTEIKIDDDEHVILREDEVLGILE